MSIFALKVSKTKLKFVILGEKTTKYMKTYNFLAFDLGATSGRSVVGTLLDLDGLVVKLGGLFESKFKSKKEGPSIAEGFVTSSLVFCVGAMTVVGSLNAGLYGDNSMLYTKAMLDLVSACVFASTLGFGVTLGLQHNLS